MNPNIPNPSNPWEVWNPNVQGFPPLPPLPLMSLPLPTPPFVQTLHPPIMLNPSVHDTPSYAGITSPVFTRQVPPRCLPNLRFPPPNPPFRGQPIWNPYIISEFTPAFGHMFDSMQEDNRVVEGKGQLANAVIEYRSKSLQEQLDQFMYARTLSAEQVQIRWQLVLDLLFILRKEFPMCEVHPFGSVISGLGDITSDIDIYVDLVGPHASSPTLSPVKALDKAKRVFKKAKCPHTAHSFHVGAVIPVTHARVPVLKMRHSTSSLNCDLTFSNRFSVQNSKLITFYNNFDPRVFRFMVLIRYWLKFFKISGSNDIKNYALCLLGLVYLMQKQIIPSVFLLQQLEETQRKQKALFQNPDEIDGWDASFCENFDFINQNFQRSPIPPDFDENPAKHLLNMALEFFKMCANTNFGIVVVCPFLGEIILKGGFIPGNEVFLPDMLERYKTFTSESSPSQRLKLRSPMCIQDPFELNFNVANGTPFSTVIKFQIACAKTAQVLSEKFNRNDQQHDEPPLSIMDLFTPLPPHLKNKEIFKACRVDLKKKNVKKEILRNLGLIAEVIHLNRDDEKEQKNKYTKLPRHLAHLDELVDPNTHHNWLRTHSPNELVHFNLNRQFSDVFFAEVARCRLVGSESENVGDEKLGLEMLKLNLAKKVSSLWKQFARDFLDELFRQALKLSIDDNKVLEASGTIDAFDQDNFHGIDLYVQTWKVYVPLQANERSPGRKEEFRKKVFEVKDIPENEAGYHRRMSVQVSYPFWRERPVVLKEWKENEKKTVGKNGKVAYQGNPIEVEAEITEDVLKHWKAKNIESKGKENVDNDEDCDVQVVEERPQSSKKRVRMENEDFTPFELDVLVKITANVGNDLDILERPTMTLIFQNKANGPIFKTALTRLNFLVQSVFPEYQEYRLREWLSNIGTGGDKANEGNVRDQ